MKHNITVIVYRPNGERVAKLDGFESLSKAYNITSAIRDRVYIEDEVVEEPLPYGAVRLENFPAWKIVWNARPGAVPSDGEVFDFEDFDTVDDAIII